MRQKTVVLLILAGGLMFAAEKTDTKQPRPVEPSKQAEVKEQISAFQEARLAVYEAKDVLEQRQRELQSASQRLSTYLEKLASEHGAQRGCYPDTKKNMEWVCPQEEKGAGK